MTRPLSGRLRDLGIPIGELMPGPLNAITDVAGVRVGHQTLNDGDGPLRPGRGPVRTGVTVILPHAGNLFSEKVPAAVHTINGFGKPYGFEQVRELGVLESPIALTNTLNVGLVVYALVQDAVRKNPEIGITAGSVNVLVGETNDGYLNDLQGRHVRAEHVFAALEAASGGMVAEGAVGAGTGTTCFGWKGGIGTSSRRISKSNGSSGEDAYTFGALVQTNFGRSRDLRIDGVPIGLWLQPPADLTPPPQQGGSVIVVLATDAPIFSRQLGRLCARASAGLARTGSRFSHGSGDYVIAFGTAHRFTSAGSGAERFERIEDSNPVMNGLFQAVIECVEEAVVNSLCAAETVTGRDGQTAYGIPVDRVVSLLNEARGRYAGGSGVR